MTTPSPLPSRRLPELALAVLPETGSLRSRVEEPRTGTRVVEFPPDFLHGAATLDELYAAFGEAWVEGALFVEYHLDETGSVCGASAARFEDWFLKVEHTDVRGSELRSWVDDRLRGRHTVVELQVDSPYPPIRATSRWIDIHVSSGRLRELEREHLQVTRDGAPCEDDQRQTDLLSLVCLCARLGVDRLS